MELILLVLWLAPSRLTALALLANFASELCYAAHLAVEELARLVPLLARAHLILIGPPEDHVLANHQSNRVPEPTGSSPSFPRPVEPVPLASCVLVFLY